MADIYDISSIPARFAAEVTRGAELEERLAARNKQDRRAENTTAAQTRCAAMSTLPEEMPDYAGMLSAEPVYPNVFTGCITGCDYKPVTVPAWQRVVEALCGKWGRV